MTHLDGGEVLNLVGVAFSGVMSPTRRQHRIIVTDTRYIPISVDALRQSVITDPVLAPASYMADTFDCDDYCLYLKSKVALAGRCNSNPAPFAVGFVLTRFHAFNFCIDNERHVAILNTQSADHLDTSDPSQFAAFLGVSTVNLVDCVLI